MACKYAIVTLHWFNRNRSRIHTENERYSSQSVLRKQIKFVCVSLLIPLNFLVNTGSLQHNAPPAYSVFWYVRASPSHFLPAAISFYSRLLRQVCRKGIIYFCTNNQNHIRKWSDNEHTMRYQNDFSTY